MPETSLVVKAIDQLTTPVKSMAKAVSSFKKDAEDLRLEMYNLSKKKAYVKLDLRQARQELHDAQKQFDKTHSKADGLRVLFKEMEVDALSQEVRSLNKVLKETDTALSKVGNRANASGKSGGFTDALKTFTKSSGANQLGQLVSNATGQYANYWLGSRFGEDSANTWSSAMSSAISGGVAGSFLGPWGTAIGTAIGAASGYVSGVAQKSQKKDDFFKDYYGNLYEERLAASEEGLTSGSATAGSREQSYKAFEKRLGTAQANAYLAEVKSMAAQTNYGYDEILGYSKLLLNSYTPDETFGLLTTLSDATAGLGLDSGGVEMFIKGLSRMRTTGKVTQEYLNYFSERGVDVYEALAQGMQARGKKVDKSQIADLVTKGQIKGGDAAEYIVEFLNQTYGGLSKELMDTYDAKVANLKDVETNVQEGYGTSYNEERKPVVQAMTEALDGKLGGALTEVNELAGFAQGYAENMKENTWLDVMEAVFNGDTELREGVAFDEKTQSKVDQYRDEYLSAYFRYYDAKEAGDRKGMYEAALEIDRIRQQTEVLAGEVFGESGTNKELVDSQADLATETRTLANAFSTWAEQYALNQAQTKGRSGAEGIVITSDVSYSEIDPTWGGFGKDAWGLNYVPYDNYPALLHQGERILTAQQAREADRGQGVSVVISGNQFHIREDADVDRVAEALLNKLQLAAVRG